MAAVGLAGNSQVAGRRAARARRPGVYIGSTPLEGMWGLLMLDEIDNAGSWLLGVARDDATGRRSSGFGSVLAGHPVRLHVAARLVPDGHRR